MILFISLFSFLGSGKDEDEEETALTPEAEAALDEIETILTNLIPTTGEMDETMPTEAEEDDEDEGGMMAA